MRSGRRRWLSPSMVVALTALVVALAGSAFAANGGFAGSDGSIQGCVTQPGLINGITGTAGAVLIVAPGDSCPADTKPLTFTGPPPIFSTDSTKKMPLGTSNKVEAQLSLPGGDYLINGKVTAKTLRQVAVDQIVACVLLDPNGTAIPNTTTYATVPANTTEDVTIPISADLTNMPPGNVSLACKDPVATTNRAARHSPEAVTSSTPMEVAEAGYYSIVPQGYPP